MYVERALAHLAGGRALLPKAHLCGPGLEKFLFVDVRIVERISLRLTLRSARADQAMQIDENTGDFDASIRWNRN